MATTQLAKTINWYPGHMFSGMKAMMGKLSQIDCVIEVHDARVPLTGRNLELKRKLGTIKPHVLVLNKCDLADLSKWDQVQALLRQNGDTNILLTSLTGQSADHTQRGYSSLIPLVVDIISRSDRHNRQDTTAYKTMIVGIPNVGKSSLINRLRQHHLGKRGEPAEVGAKAGVTKYVMQKIRICSKPRIYVYDTPGVLQPDTTKSHKRAMRLAMCSTISDEAVGIWNIAKFTFEWLKERGIEGYVPVMGLDEPVDTFDELVFKSSLAMDKIVNFRDRFTGEERKMPNIDAICQLFVKSFRRGAFGRVLLEDL